MKNKYKDRALPMLFTTLAAIIVALLLPATLLFSQETPKKEKREFKNVIRYNLSSGLLFGISRYVVFGYERVVSPHQSFSINIGRAALPKLVSINTDSFSVSKDAKNNGINVSVDYRFYLAKENKYHAPHGLYIGPYYSFNHFSRENNWNYQHASSGQHLVTTKIDFTINTIGGEMGYQFVLWNRLTLDFVMIGPGVSYYDLKADISGDLSDKDREQLKEALRQLITQKIPGMNYVFANKHLDADGFIRTWSVGFRYLIQVGFRF